MQTLVSLILKFAVDFFARIFGDWRRDVAIKEAGVAEERGRVATSVAAAERRAAEVPSLSEDDAIDKLDKGSF